MNENDVNELKHQVGILQVENKYHIERCDYWRERFEEADKEIIKVGASMWIIGIFIGAVIGNAIIGWLG